MLDFISKQFRKNSARKAAETFKRGIVLLERGKVVQARPRLELAVKYDPSTAVPLLEADFEERWEASRFVEAALLGDVLFQFKGDDYSLANRLGNCFRRIGESKRANEFYKLSYGINKRYDDAFYNLAASLAQVPKYDGEAKRLVELYIKTDRFLIPKSTYPRDPRILSHLAGILNDTYFFHRVDRIQELIFKKALEKEEPDFDQIDQLMEKISQKLRNRFKLDKNYSNIIDLLKEAMNQEWNTLPASEKDRFLWDVLNIALYVMTRYGEAVFNDQVDENAQFIDTDFQLAVDCFVRLKIEGYSFRYIDMIIAISHCVSGDMNQAIDEMKSLLRDDPNDRYLNINMGLLYRKAGNRLLSTVFLVKGASLLEETEGRCHLADIIELADQQARKGALKSALRLYRLASLETDTEEVLTRIGEILLSLDRYYDAIQPFKEILRMNPESDTANQNLDYIQEHFYFLANEFYSKKAFVEAASNYEKALEIKRTPEVLLKAMTTYKMVGDHKKQFARKEEYHRLVTEKREQKTEESRNDYVRQGKECIKTREWQQAISYFQKAFDVRADKEIFMFLSYIYKKLNQKKALADLMRQWKTASN